MGKMVYLNKASDLDNSLSTKCMENITNSKGGECN